MPTFRGNRVNRPNVRMTPPEGYGDYSNPNTFDEQRQKDRAFDKEEARVKDKAKVAQERLNPNKGTY